MQPSFPPPTPLLRKLFGEHRPSPEHDSPGGFLSSDPPCRDWSKDSAELLYLESKAWAGEGEGGRGGKAGSKQQCDAMVLPWAPFLGSGRSPPAQGTSAEVLPGETTSQSRDRKDSPSPVI